MPANDNSSSLINAVVFVLILCAIAGYWLSAKQRGTRAKQQPGKLVPVPNSATVQDMTGQKKSFSFVHMVDSNRLEKAKKHRREATAIVKEVTMPHYR
jgi:hypothetical protein